MKWFNNLRNAATNLVHALITPRHVQHDEIVAREFCQKMRGLGEDPEEALSAVAMFTAIGITSSQAAVFARISSANRVTLEDLNQLAQEGMEIVPLEKKGQ